MALITAAFASLLAAPSLAADHPPFVETAWPAEVRKVFDYARTECGTDKDVKVTFAPDTVRKLDLNGDGRDDYIVDLKDATCSEHMSAYCGTGGCWTEILVTRPGGRVESIFGDVVRSYKVLPRKSRPGPVTMTFDLHGGRCGRAGVDPCPKTRRIMGQPFAFR